MIRNNLDNAHPTDVINVVLRDQFRLISAL